MKLRGYQTDLLNITRNSFYSHNRVLTVAPCGAGKTILFAEMCTKHVEKNPNNYVWFLVHRQELVEQTIKTFRDNNLDMTNIFIGMVQTVTRHLETYKKPTLIVFDEAHHAKAKQWTNIIDAYPNVPLIGLTATPCRMDGKPLGDIFDTLCENISAEELINLGYLCEYKYYAPHIELEDANWQVKGSDYDMNDVSEKLDKPQIYGDIIKYIDINRKTIIYAPNIKYSIKLQDEINTHFNSVICKHFDGDTPKAERKQIIQDFRDGKIRMLTNVDLIGEGFDVPDCDCCILLRPTMSVSLYIQQSMRCLRPAPNKTAIIYDFVGNVFKHGMPTDKREWSLNKVVKMRNKSNDKELIVRECKKCLRVYKGSNSICPYCGANNGKTKTQIEEDKKAELIEIKELEKKKERREVGMCRSLESLVELGKRRGYKNPTWWARNILNARNNKYKNY